MFSYLVIERREADATRRVDHACAHLQAVAVRLQTRQSQTQPASPEDLHQLHRCQLKILSPTVCPCCRQRVTSQRRLRHRSQPGHRRRRKDPAHHVDARVAEAFAAQAGSIRRTTWRGIGRDVWRKSDSASLPPPFTFLPQHNLRVTLSESLILITSDNLPGFVTATSSNARPAAELVDCSTRANSLSDHSSLHSAQTCLPVCARSLSFCYTAHAFLFAVQ